MARLGFFKVIVLFTLASLLCAVSAEEYEPNVKDFVGKIGTRLKKLRRDCLGVDIIQKEVNEKVKSAAPLEGNKLIKDLTAVIRKRFLERITALKAVKKGVEVDYGDKVAGKRKECCKLSPLSMDYNARFKAKVDKRSCCEMTSKTAGKKARGLGEGTYDAMIKNLKENHRLKWQYFGSVEGLTTMFPSSHVKHCGKYDNRLRPWYVTTASPVTKKIVLLLDTSTSMAATDFTREKKTTRLEVAQEAVNSVLNTLLQGDKVGVVMFNTRVNLPGTKEVDGCYNTTLASAGPFNIDHLKKFVSRAKPGGGTHYKKAFDTAFTLLRSSASKRGIILFITDGAPKDSKKAIYKSVQKHQQDMANAGEHITIITLGLGKDLKMKRFLHKFSTEVGSKNTYVDNVADIRTGLSTYYNYLNSFKKPDMAYTVSSPYVDAWGLGLLITVAVPCFSKGKLMGVAGVDITIPDLLSEVQYFNQAGSDSYAFIVHLRTGNTLSHPLMPPPEVVTKDPSLIQILALEPGDAFKKFFTDSLKQLTEQEVQSLSLSGRRRPQARGGLLEEGVKEITLDYQYYCSRVLEYVVCLALAAKDSKLDIKENTNDKLSYHRMDLVQGGEICYYADALSYRGKSVVKFSAKAFVDPPEYLDVDETSKNATNYMTYANHREEYKLTPMFLSGIVETARMGKRLEHFWIHGEHKQYLTQIPRRFLGSFNGVLRFFPGEPLPRTYDHSTRHWYLKARANPGELVFTTPYRDPLGAGLIITVSHSISMTTKNRKSLFGVVAADLTLSYFDTFVKKYFGFRCKDTKTTTCMLVDTAGYVVFHPSFAKKLDAALVKSKHITQMHGHIAEYLTQEGIMRKTYCQNFAERKMQMFYELDIGDAQVFNNRKWTANKCDAFVLAKIANTNLFVLAAFASSRSACYASASCMCNKTCSAPSSTVCECPCVKRLDYDYCRDVHLQSSLPACTPPSARVSTRPPLPPHAADLPKCFKTRCKEIQTEGSCRQTFACSWCTREGSNELETPFCSHDNECYGGVLGRKNPFKRKLPPKKTEKKFSLPDLVKDNFIMICAVASVFLLLLITAIITCCCCLRKRKPLEGEYSELQEYYPGDMEGGMYEGEAYEGDGEYHAEGFERDFMEGMDQHAEGFEGDFMEGMDQHAEGFEGDFMEGMDQHAEGFEGDFMEGMDEQMYYDDDDEYGEEQVGYDDFFQLGAEY